MGDIDFKVISATENSNTFQKTRFWKEKSVEDVVTLGPMAQAILVPYYYKEIITKKLITSNCSRVFFFQFCEKKDLAHFFEKRKENLVIFTLGQKKSNFFSFFVIKRTLFNL